MAIGFAILLESPPFRAAEPPDVLIRAVDHLNALPRGMAGVTGTPKVVSRLGSGRPVVTESAGRDRVAERAAYGHSAV